MLSAFIIKRSAVLCSLAIFIPLASVADDTIEVTAKAGHAADLPTLGYTAKTTKGATKTDQPLILTAQAVSVITRQQMDDQNVATVNQALNYTPGVFTNFSGGATRYDTIALRGFHGGDVNNTFLDGLRLLSDGGSYNVLQVDPWFLERIDVIKGPSSALYGQSIPGGVVMMTSKRPQFTSEGHFRLIGGNNNTQSAAFDYTDAISEHWAFRLTGITRNSDTMYDHQREERYAIAPSLLWQPDENTSLLLRANLQKDPSGGSHSSVPADGSIYGQKLSRGFFDGESDRNVFKRWQQIYSSEFSHKFDDVWSFRQNASYTHSNTQLEQVYQGGWNSDRTLMNRYYSGEDSSLNAFAVDNQLEADFATAAVGHKVMLGFDFQKFSNNLRSDSAYATTLNPYTGVSGGSTLYRDYLLTTPGINTSYLNRRYEQSGVYLQDEMTLDNWHLNLSGRYDRMKTENSDKTANSSDERTDNHASGRAALLYSFDSGISPYVSYSQAITPSLFPDAQQKLLKPMTSEQYEVGIKYQPPGSTSLYSAALYDLTQNDVANRAVPATYYVPAGKVNSQGLELEARSQISDRLSVIAGYTYNRVKFKDAIDGNDGNTPVLAPSNMASLWAQYEAGYGINVGAGIRYIGKQWADDANTLRVPSYTLGDASVRADLGTWAASLKGAFIQLNVNNIADKKYIAACYNTSYCYWGAERSVLATVGYDF
ncbi:TonB-dependent siderophore receptor [Yersinia bercovieri]|uniref:TonB-dependent siderophore receptor n=1 Tax=Yersinia bercovieri TaxID=634 RepID=UPI0011A56DB0|nr:TonB-dependent siderophore receptor [Yersinia bercovieri]MCB5303634.1 TonB-dependent siderophore receptor [Yersinia bercovieri]